MAVRVSCPSCNTTWTLPSLPGERRVTCPRCSDQFPLRHWEEIAEALPTPGLGSPPPVTAGRGRRLLAIGGVGLLGVVVGLVLLFNRDRTSPRAQLEPTTTTGAVTPAPQLVGVRYLPADANLIFAVQMGPILAYAQRTQQDPATLLQAAGLPTRFLATLNQLNLNLEQIDHIVGGTALGDGAFEVRLTLVLVLRGLLPDDDAFLQKLKARRQSGVKPRYDVELAGLPLTLARVSDVVWVFGFDARKDLQSVDRGESGLAGKHLAPSLQTILADQVPPTATAWLAAADELWAEKPGAKFLAELQGRKELLPLLSKGRAAMLAVCLTESPHLRLYLKAADEATGQQVRTYFQRQAATNPAIQFDGQGERVVVDLPIVPAKTMATLEQFLSDAMKK
jgi:hypothetical protein